MTYQKLIVIALLLSLCSNNHFAQQADYGSGAIKTTYGFLLVRNEPESYYTLEIRGKDVRAASTQYVIFNVDGKFLQILNVTKEQFLKNSKKEQADERAMLTAYRDWESQYLESTYKERLNVQSDWEKLPNGRQALAWQITVPESAHTNVKKQLYLCIVNGEHVMALQGLVTSEIAESDARQLLRDTLLTLKVSEQPIDLLKLQEAVRRGSEK